MEGYDSLISGDNLSQVTQVLLARTALWEHIFKSKEHETELEGWLTGSVRSTNPFLKELVLKKGQDLFC